ncbi:MAG: RnfABCDGE type electron transport complex subunit G [Nitrospirota bacterium]
MTSKDILKITLTLVLIYVIGGIILAAVYAKTAPIIYRNAVLEKERALRELMPEADEIIKAGEWIIHDKQAEYFLVKKGGKNIGYIIQSFGKGYSSYINTLIAVDTDFTIRSINIINHAETPGLGDEIEAESFRNRFTGKDANHLKVVKTETQEHIEAISGATISTKAVAEDAVKNGIDFLIKSLKGKEYGTGKKG